MTYGVLCIRHSVLIQHYSMVHFSIVGCSGSPSTVFNDSLSCTLSQLGMPDLTLKADERLAPFTVEVVLPWQEYLLPFLFNHKLGLVCSQKKNCVIVISPLISLMSQKSQNEWR